MHSSSLVTRSVIASHPHVGHANAVRAVLLRRRTPRGAAAACGTRARRCCDLPASAQQPGAAAAGAAAECGGHSRPRCSAGMTGRRRCYSNGWVCKAWLMNIGCSRRRKKQRSRLRSQRQQQQPLMQRRSHQHVQRRRRRNRHLPSQRAQRRSALPRPSTWSTCGTPWMMTWMTK